MNIQNLMKQAQSMQKKMMESKEKVEKEVFIGKSELVTVKMNGKRKVLSVEISKNAQLDQDDIEILEDMISLAMNDALSQVNSALEKALGSQAGLMNGLF